MINVIKATTPEHYHTGATLFKQYADSLDFTLSFQSFDDELTILQNMYGWPTGALLLVEIEGIYIGVVGLRQIENDQTCEIKRMYIQPEYQGRGVGKLLMTKIIDEAITLNYKTVKLDTLAKMTPAVALYKSFGFLETTPYNYNPYPDVLYLKKDLSG